jgi:predicted permease
LKTFQEERAAGWTGQTKLFIDRFLNQTLVMERAGSGISNIQKNYRLSLIVLGVLVGLVLLIASANVANLLAAQAAARAREMALRVSIGAGRGRLIQMVLSESAILGFVSSALGALFAWWAAPFVVSRISSPGNPSRLFLPADWRVLAFGLAIAVSVTFLFALAPALRVSSLRPASALKGGEDPHSRNRLMHALIAAQVAFCFVVHLAAGLFATTSDRLAHQSTGFVPDRLVTLETTSRQPQDAAAWNEVTEHLRSVAGVESVALSGWALLNGTGWNGFIWAEGGPTEVLAYFLGISPGWVETMGIPMLDGRDLRPEERYPNVAIVNEAFVRQCLGGANPIGQWFEKESGNGVSRDRFQVVGVVRDARYRNMREPITPTAYVPFHSVNSKGEARRQASGTFIVRTRSANPLAIASVLRREVPKARSEFRVSNIRTEKELIEQHTVRERLLAMLALFFAAIAVLLAGVGLYGVLDYSVLQRRREFGIRIAIGAPVADIVRRVTLQSFAVVFAGALCGLVAGMILVRYVETLLYGAKASDIRILAIPCITIAVAALLASVPASIRAVRVDPVTMLRAE